MHKMHLNYVENCLSVTTLSASCLNQIDCVGPVIPTSWIAPEQYSLALAPYLNEERGEREGRSLRGSRRSQQTKRRN